MFVVIQGEKSRSFIWVGGSKDWSFLVNPPGVVEVIAERVHTLSANTSVSALIDRCEGI